jgi:hypothetical protein
MLPVPEERIKGGNQRAEPTTGTLSTWRVVEPGNELQNELQNCLQKGLQ